MKNETLESVQEYENPLWVDEGGEALVYRISDDKVAKVTKFSEGHDRLRKESMLAEQLHQDGFPVPKPYGINKVTIRDEDIADEDAFIMEFITGRKCDVLSSEQERYVDSELARIRQEAVSKGYTPHDMGLVNTMLTPDGIKIIDFSLWEYDGEK